MYTLGQEHFQDEARQPEPIQFTAGAVQVINRKGEVSMQKVHVKRYIAGKRPEYAGEDSSSEDEDGFHRTRDEDTHHGREVARGEDRRLQRLEQMDDEQVDVEERLRRRRQREPEVIEESEEEEEIPKRKIHQPIQLEEESDDEDLNEQQMEERRMMRRMRARSRVNQEEELMRVDEEVKEDEEESSGEEEEETDSDEEDSEDEDHRLKPVFVRKKDRLTIQEREKEEQRMEELAIESKKAAEARKRETIRQIEAERRAELEQKEATNEAQLIQSKLNLLDEEEDNQDDEAEYEKWKLRELKRVKRDREEREQMQKEREEVERLSKMTEEERIQMNRQNPRQVTNKKEKGKMKYLQKYYHRGAFFMEKEEEVYTRDFAQPTLDDHFDKLVLPKVMQVKNFGRSGRTKYTHLVDQDTTSFDSPWALGSASTSVAVKGKPRKQEFQRPSSRKQN